MEKQDIHLGDVQRILLGDAPPEFLIEVFFRTLITYTLLLFIVRWLGKRMAGQLTITEMSVMIMLGAIVSGPMQLPDRGMLPGMLILLGIVLLQRGSTWLGIKNTKIEQLITGKTILLIKDGILQLKEMEQSRITRQQIFAKLRANEVYNLKKVKRMYMEACGLFSIFKEEQDSPGLSTYPTDDKQIAQELPEAGDGELLVCSNCGNVSAQCPGTKCAICGNDTWTKPTL